MQQHRPSIFQPVENLSRFLEVWKVIISLVFGTSLICLVRSNSRFLASLLCLFISSSLNLTFYSMCALSISALTVILAFSNSICGWGISCTPIDLIFLSQIYCYLPRPLLSLLKTTDILRQVILLSNFTILQIFLLR